MGNYPSVPPSAATSSSSSFSLSSSYVDSSSEFTACGGSILRSRSAEFPASQRDEGANVQLNRKKKHKRTDEEDYKSGWEQAYDFVHRRYMYVNHTKREIRHESPAIQGLRVNPSPLTFQCVDLPSNTYSTAIKQEVQQLCNLPQPAHSIFAFDSGESSRASPSLHPTSNGSLTIHPPAFIRFMQSRSGLFIRRHIDVATLNVSRYLAVDAIRNEEDLIRVRKDWLIAANAMAPPQPNQATAIPALTGDAAIIQSVIAKLTDILHGRKGKHLLQPPIIASLLQVFNPLPNGSLGACPTYAAIEDIPAISTLWAELTTASKLLTLQPLELEHLVELTLLLIMKSASVAAVLRSLDIWTAIHFNYSAVHFTSSQLSLALQCFSFDLQQMINKEIGETSGVGSHVAAHSYRSQALALAELKLRHDAPLHIHAVMSFVLAHVSLLAETHVYFKRHNHLRVDSPSSQLPPHQPLAKPTSLFLPYVMDLKGKTLVTLVEKWNELIQLRQNERMNHMLNHGTTVIDATSFLSASASGVGTSASANNVTFPSTIAPHLPQVNSVLKELFSSSSISEADHPKSVKLLMKLLSNILSAPSSEKFRRIKSNHSSFVQLIKSVPARINVLKLIGFEVEDTRMEPEASGSSDAATNPNDNDVVCIPVTPVSADASPQPVHVPNFPSHSGLPQTSFVSFSIPAKTASAATSSNQQEVEEFMYLSTDALNVPLIQHVVNQLQNHLDQLHQLQSMTQRTNNTASAASATPEFAQSSSHVPTVTPPFPFLTSHRHPSNSNALNAPSDFFHILSLIKLYLYAANTYKLDASALSGANELLLSSGSSVWSSLVDHIIVMLDLSDSNRDSAINAVFERFHSNSPFAEHKSFDQLRVERSHLTQVLILAFPFCPPMVQAQIVRASLRDDCLRVELDCWLQRSAGCGFDLLPTHSNAPFKSVWERLQSADTRSPHSVLALVSNDKQLLHNLISSFSQGQLQLPARGVDAQVSAQTLFQHWSPAAKTVIDYLIKTQSLSSKHALQVAHSSNLAAASSVSSAHAVGEGSGMMLEAQTLSPSSNMLLSPSLSPYSIRSSSSSRIPPSLDLGPRSVSHADDSATHAKEFPNRSGVISPIRDTASTNQAAAASATSFSNPTVSARASSLTITPPSRNIASPMLSPRTPSISFSPSPSPSSPVSPSLHSWNIDQHENFRADVARYEFDLHQYEQLLEELFRAISNPTSFSAVASLSANAASNVAHAYLSVFQSLMQNWMSRCVCPLTSHDSFFTPQLVRAGIRILLSNAVEAIRAVQQQAERDQSEDAATLHARYLSSPIVSILSPTLIGFAHMLAALSQTFSVDPPFLAQLYQVHNMIGDFHAWDADNLALDSVIQEPSIGCEPQYEDYFKYALPSDPVLDFIRAPMDGNGQQSGVSPLMRLLQSQATTVAPALLATATQLQQIGSSSVIPSSCQPLPPALIQIIEEHLFHAHHQTLQPHAPAPSSMSKLRMDHSNLFTCMLCAQVFPDADSLSAHSTSPPNAAEAASSGNDSLCKNSRCSWSLLRHSLLYVITDVSRQLACCSTSTVDASTAINSRLFPEDAKQQMSSNKIQHAASIADKPPESDLRAPVVPKTIEQWMKSDLIACGIEPAFLHHDASFGLPSQSDVLPPEDLTNSAKLFPFFHTKSFTRFSSKVASPARTPRKQSITSADGKIELSSREDMTDLLKSESPAAIVPRPSHETSQSNIFDHINPHTQHAFDSITPVKESSITPIKGEESNSLVPITVEAVRVSAVHVAGTPDRTIALLNESRMKIELIQPFKSPMDAPTPTSETLPPIDISFANFPSPAQVEIYPHFQFLSALIAGEEEARMLDDTIMAHPSMRMASVQRRMVGEAAVRASRAVIACLLKHTGKVEAAVQYCNNCWRQTNRAPEVAAKIPIPPSLLQLWKLSAELFAEFIALHQNGLQLYCAVTGCDQTVIEDNSSRTSYRCGKGHVSTGCISREAVKYEILASRVMHNCELLLKFQPAYKASNNDAKEIKRVQILKRRAVRAKKVASLKALDLYASTSLSRQSSLAEGVDSQLSVPANLSRSTSSNLSAWSPSPRTPSMSPPISSSALMYPAAVTTIITGLSRSSSEGVLSKATSSTIATEQSTPVGSPRPAADETANAAVAFVPVPTSNVRKLRESIRRELAQHRWHDLRAELMASRMPSIMQSATVPLTTLIMSFCREVGIDTLKRAHQIEAAVRRSVLIAEYRTRGLESLAYLIREGPVDHKASALVQFNSCPQMYESQSNAGVCSSGALSATALSETSSESAVIDLNPFSLQHRYDYSVHGISQGCLTQLQDSFYAGLSANLEIINSCLQALHIGHQLNRQEIIVEDSLAPTKPFTALSRISQLRQKFMANNENDTTSCHLSLLLQAINSWFVRMTPSAADLHFVHSSQLLSLLTVLIMEFQSVRNEEETTSTQREGDSHMDETDKAFCQSIGGQVRKLFRMLALTVLLQRQASAILEDQQGNDDISAAHVESAAAAVTAASTTATSDSTIVKSLLDSSSFEVDILRAIFSKLEFTLLHRMNIGPQAKADQSMHLHAFIHVQDEQDFYENLSLLLLACSAVHIKLTLSHHVDEDEHSSSASESASTSLPSLSSRCFQLLSQLLHPSIFPKLSLRCQRRSLSLAQILLPLVTPKVIELLWNDETDTNDVMQDVNASTTATASPPSHLISYLLRSIGFYACDQLLESVEVKYSHGRCVHLASMLIALVRQLHQSATWTRAVSTSLAHAIQQIRHNGFSLAQHSEQEQFYSAFAALLVYGGFVEPIRVGAKVELHRVSGRAERLANRDAYSTEEEHATSATVNSTFGYVVGFEANQAIVVQEGESMQHMQLKPLSSLTAVPTIGCTQPLHLYGAEGIQNLTTLIRFINSTFHQQVESLSPTSNIDSKDVNANFSLFSLTTSGSDTACVLRFQFAQSLLKVNAMRALNHSLSLVLTTPELVASNTLQAMNNDLTPSLNTVDVVIQVLLKESGCCSTAAPDAAPAAARMTPFISNLLSVSHQVIPLANSIGTLESLHRKMEEIHALIHGSNMSARPAPAGIHPDLFARGMRLFQNDAAKALDWSRLKHQQYLRVEEDVRRGLLSQLTVQASFKSMKDMGYEDALCSRALLLHNGDLAQATKWLSEHGKNEIESIRRGTMNDIWGLEGVDFYQEQGHWTPTIHLQVEEEDDSNNNGTNAASSSTKAAKDNMNIKLDLVDSALKGRKLVSQQRPSTLPHSPPQMDPYRRLALYTAPQMSAHAIRCEQIYQELTGSPSASSVSSATAAVTPLTDWKIESNEIQLGQRLRVSRKYVAKYRTQQQFNHNNQSQQEYRWYFLTEDNHWAPLDSKEMKVLEEHYARGASFLWIGVEDKSPSLVRLDKMCMYNEMTGHGRPLRRKLVDKNPLTKLTVNNNARAAAAQPESKQPPAVASSVSTAASSSSTLPSPYLFDSLSPLHRELAVNLSHMGFPREWCAFALSCNAFQADRAADWLLTDGNAAKCESHDAAIQAKLQAQAAKENETKKLQQEAERNAKKEHETDDRIAAQLAEFLRNHATPELKSTADVANVKVDEREMIAFAGKVGTVLGMIRGNSHGSASASLSSSTSDVLIRLEMIDEERSCIHRIWVPLAALEFDTHRCVENMPEYANLHKMQFLPNSVQSGHKRITQVMQTHIYRQMAASSMHDANSDSSSNNLFHLATDVTTSLFMVYARRIALLLIYLLSLPQGKPTMSTAAAASPIAGQASTQGSSSSTASIPVPSAPLFTASSSPSAASRPQSMELIANFSASILMKIVKLASVDPILTFPIDSSVNQQIQPSTPGLLTRNEFDDEMYKQQHLQHQPSDGMTHHPPFIDIWLVLSTLLHNPSPLFSSPSRDQLVALLIDDCRRNLHSSSYFVRDIDTEHPYQSGVDERNQEIHIPHATSLLVTFDRRCNLNQSHAVLAFYSDKNCTDELAVFSGSAEEFSHVVVPGDRFYYTFHSGGVRSKPYEFGFRFRVRPLGFQLSSEAQILHNITPSMATAINLNSVSTAAAVAQQHNVGVLNTTTIASPLAPETAWAFSHTLGWHLFLLISDSPALLDLVLSHAHALELMQCMLRYLTVCRSPCKVLVTRALTALCVRVKTPMATTMFEILLRVMEQLYESNTASGWGSSPFLMALVDLVRMRPSTFKLSDADVWCIEQMDNRPASWFFLTVVRAESLSKALLSSQRLPHVRLLERAFAELTDYEILRWCLKQPELCLKLHKQSRGWNQARRDWMVAINGFQNMQQAGQVLIQLKDSLLPECFRFTSWTVGTAAREWEDKVKVAQTVADISNLYMELEGSLKLGDLFAEADRAFGDTWSSRRGDWLAAMRGLASEKVVRVASPAEAIEYRWTRGMDEALVRHWDEVASKSARRLMSLSFRDIDPLTPEQIAAATAQSGPAAPSIATALRAVPIEQLRARFAVLKLLSTDYMRVLPVVDLSFNLTRWSLSSVVKQTTKHLVFHQSKMYLWRSMLGRLYSEERPQFVILNRHQASKKRSSVASRLQNSLFFQLYTNVGQLCDPSSLRRRGQAWMVKFVGEGGHDVGGMYNESLVELCNELQSEATAEGSAASVSAAGSKDASIDSTNAPSQPPLPLFRLCPNGQHVIGENRNKFLPNPTATSPLSLSMFDFVGRLMGICCLDNNRALPLNLPSLLWKVVVGESLTLLDLKGIDYHTWNIIHLLRSTHSGGNAVNVSTLASGSGDKVTAESFPYLFPDLTFSVEVEEETPSQTYSREKGIAKIKRVIDLIPNGRNVEVTYSTCMQYAAVLEQFHLGRYNHQLKQLCKGMSSIVPFEFLSVFTWHQLETLVTGNPDIDVNLLREKTEYRGNVQATDAHIVMFWQVLEEMSQPQRKAFLQFTWGRTRLPHNALGFGKDLFKLSDHAQALQAGSHDQYLPVAHTCFFALELPRFSSIAVLRSKLLYAISNCQSIDGDATHEGRANMMMAWEEEEDEA